jgi:hypothetical protein
MTGSLRAYSRHRGCALRAVQKAIEAGRIQVESDGSVDFEKADAAWEARTHPTRGKTEAVVSKQAAHRSSAVTEGARIEASDRKTKILTEVDYYREHAEHEQAKKQLLLLKLAVQEGRLVEREVEEASGRAVATETRDAILGVPDRISAILAAETQPARVHELLTDELMTALERLSVGG